MTTKQAVSQRGMQPEDILRINWVSDPQISPDARKVAYVVTTLDEKTNENRSHIKIVDLDSGEPKRLTNGPKRDSMPRWSPDSRHVAFISERGDEKAQVWLIDADGGEAWRLTNTPDAASNPAWSPDGYRIAFTSKQQTDPPDKAPDGKPFQKIRKITTFKYKSNGDGIVDDLHSQVFVVDVDLEAREPRPGLQLTRSEFTNSAPVWSPDGTQLAFSSARHASRDNDNASDIWVLDVPEPGATKASGRPRRVTQTLGPAVSPAWSPDGSEIAYLGHTGRRSGVARHHKLWKVAVSGGEPVCLTQDLNSNCVAEAAPNWSADGSSVSCLVVDAGNVHLHQVTGNGKRRLTIGGSRSVSSARYAGGCIAFTASDASHPTEVFLCGEDGNDERVITAENVAWLESVSLAEPETIEVTSEDGTPVQAWVMRPHGRSGQVPCLLNVHGGPKGQYGNTFMDEFQVYAGAGYAVVYGNPRGSDGQSEAFSATVIGAWGDKDWQDVTAIADAIGKMSYVDQSRVGIMGGSYGGFMTSWAVGHTNRFKSACSERAVNNLHSMVGTSDIGAWFLVQHAGGTMPYHDLDTYMKMSPIYYAANIETPLLIIHAENDLRCPIEQGEQLFVALKLQKKPVEFWRFPEDSHEMSRSGKPRNRLKRFEVILEWFDRSLNGSVK